ncbi:alpha/beta hydrolase [Thalassospira xiamenensis]|uniref:Esterase n=1 Tax=Thalassospira xiamenensis TaxID=220697 RepID=A0A367X7Y1_9PROT|nr:alpha/beta hydrolase [Thalassospira xiamenensis]KZB50836.1 esterase [Thalassospira xiamenensis]MCK2165194.1 alpha/beta hydrolase [Thalassospira xiamenensis]RCK49776.1 esterase [Thalassospira xiamenensis]
MSWGGFTLAELEWQYNPRETVPEYMTCFDRFVRLSDDTRASVRHITDIRYGGGPKETMDVYPAAEPDAPVHVFFHGGYWRSQDKKDYAFVARDLNAAGFTVICPNYDLCPDVTVAEITLQAVRCMTFIYQNIGDFNGDRDRISISGHSAGGQIVARLAAHHWEDTLDDANPFCAVVPVSGVFDLEPIRFTSINDDVRLNAATAADNSPMLDAIPHDVKMMVVVGSNESPEFVRQSDAYAAYCGREGLKVPVYKAWGANHFTVLEELYLGTGSLFGHLKRFLQR